MKKLFIIDSNNEERARTFVLSIAEKVPNIIFINYYDELKKRLNLKVDALDIPNSKTRYSLLNTIELFLINNFKKEWYQKVYDKIDFRNTDRAIIFVFTKNRHVTYHLRRKYAKSCSIKTLHLQTEGSCDFVMDNIPQNKRYDIKVEIPDFDNVKFRTRLIMKFINKHIPVKFYYWQYESI